MIINLLRYQNRFWWLLLHIALGFAATFNNVYVIFWFYFILLSTFYLLTFSNINRPLIIAATIVYIGAFEVLARMTKCSPIIPWESAKYVFASLTIIGILFTKTVSTKRTFGLIILLLMVPALFINKSGERTLNDVIFNVLGIINIGLGLIFFSSLNLRKDRFYDFIRLMIFPCVTILTYTIIRTPDLEEISFSLGAQSATSGQFGSNQVSTILGLGFLLMSFSWIQQWKLTNSRILDGMLAAAFLIQGLFTFSRGGMIGGGLGLIVFLSFLFYQTNLKITISPSIKRYAIPALILFTFAVFFTNNLTGGKLFLRYQGETQGTLLGTRERDMTTFTSGRNIIFFSDLELWAENPALGSGAGTSKYLRSEEQGVAAHIEISRLLAEQGIPGLLIFITILLSGASYLKEKDTLIRATKIALFTLAIFTTFHSATRTFVTPLLLSLCSINCFTPKKQDDTLSGQ